MIPVSDPVTTARTARESLSRGLNALQSDPNVPPALLALAGTIAQAMGALHQIERSNGTQLQPHAEVALNNTRTALAQLQAQPPTHPAVTSAMEAVAASLGLLHSLSKMAGGGGANRPAAAQQPVQPSTGYQATVAQQPAFPPPRDAFRQGGAPPAAGSPLAATFAAPGPLGAPLSSTPSQKPPSPPMPTGEIPVVNADLGTQSPTNFYKGLSGNDIVDHGGLFVSTYMVPKIGTPVRLKVSLPGGYEFEANAVVKWSREASDGSGDALPGFGAQFTQITQEARQLIYRYVRNREPLFHDDL